MCYFLQPATDNVINIGVSKFVLNSSNLTCSTLEVYTMSLFDANAVYNQNLQVIATIYTNTISAHNYFVENLSVASNVYMTQNYIQNLANGTSNTVIDSNGNVNLANLVSSCNRRRGLWNRRLIRQSI